MGVIEGSEGTIEITRDDRSKVVEDVGGVVEVKCTTVYRNDRIVVENFEHVIVLASAVIVKSGEYEIVIRKPIALKIHPCRAENLQQGELEEDEEEEE